MRSREYDWFLRADMQRYRGKYIIIKGRKVVLSGKNPKQLITTFKRKYPRETPTITKVPRDEALILASDPGDSHEREGQRPAFKQEPPSFSLAGPG